MPGKAEEPAVAASYPTGSEYTTDLAKEQQQEKCPEDTEGNFPETQNQRETENEQKTQNCIFENEFHLKADEAATPDECQPQAIARAQAVLDVVQQVQQVQVPQAAAEAGDQQVKPNTQQIEQQLDESDEQMLHKRNALLELACPEVQKTNEEVRSVRAQIAFSTLQIES